MTAKTILIITQAEMGQANCQLATLYEYITHPTPLNIHILSFKLLTSRIKKLVEWANRQTDKPNPVTIHELKSLPMVEAVVVAMGGPDGTERFLYKPNFLGIWNVMTYVDILIYPWDRQSAINVYNETKAVIEAVKPDLVQSDNLCLLARDACRVLGQDVVILSPNTVKDVGSHLQSFKTLLDWGIPGGANPMPLPYYLYPWFFLLYLRIIFILVFGKKAKEYNATRKELGIDFPTAMLDNNYPNEHNRICMTTPELDVPATITEEMACVGPIVQRVESVADKDPELLKWLRQRPTIAIVLGSHYQMDKNYADHVAHGVRVVCEARPDVQVLWKFIPRQGKEESDLAEIKGLRDEDRVRVVRWFEADPAAVMDTGDVCCVVNHGGSNSYHEAMYYGIPQVIMASWFDCYDFAIRVGIFKNGEWGNRKAAPRIEGNEFARAILKVIGSSPTDPQALATRERCLRYREIARAQGGRKRAVEIVLGVMDGIIERKGGVHVNGNGKVEEEGKLRRRGVNGHSEGAISA